MPSDAVSPSLGKRQRVDNGIPPPQAQNDGFVADPDAGESGAEDDDDEDKPKSDKKAGRRKIKIEFIQDKSRRHITFSKRKAGIMKKAYELSTLTGTQVLLLVVSETGLVYTFTTAKLQPLVTQPEGKNLIQACLNAPHGTLPSNMPVGTPIGRSAMSMPHHAQPGPVNTPGGLAINGQPQANGLKDDANGDDAPADEDAEQPERSRAPAANTSPRGQNGAALPPPPNGNAPQQQQQPPATSPQRGMAPLPVNMAPNGAQPNGAPAGQPYPPYHPPQGDPNMYAAHPGGYAPPPYFQPPGHENGPPAWAAPQQVQGAHYGRR